MSDRQFTDNPYYSPEKCGLKIVDELAAEPDYDFDMLIVWQDLKSKKYFYAHDSGCSCPSPFEEYHRLSELSKLNKTHFHSFEEAVHKGISEYRGPDSATRSRFISKWRRKLFKAAK